MKLRRDPSGAIELLLWDMPAGDIERITKTVLSEVESSGPVSITHVAGDAINCAIGSGASLTARDLLAVLEERGGGDPILGELLARLSRLPSLDAELPHRRSAAEEAEEARRAMVARMEGDLAARNLSDLQAPHFAKTKYSARQAWVKGLGVTEPFPSAGVFFAWFPKPIVSDARKDGLLAWMDCNQRRYEPCRARPFIPSLSYRNAAKGFVWGDSRQTADPAAAGRYTRYLAVEPSGWIEYGFYPGAEWEDHPERVYYARIVASCVAFLYFVRDLAERFRIDPVSIGLGAALRGTAGKHLLCVREEGLRQSHQTQPPSHDGLRFVRPPTGEDWSVGAVAAQVADEVLDLWSFWGEEWVGRPEFDDDGIHKGDCFRKRFQGF